MNPKKPALPSSAVREPAKRFVIKKLEERIAPKGPPFTRKCWSF
jgi:hypothetical protein